MCENCKDEVSYIENIEGNIEELKVSEPSSDMVLFFEPLELPFDNFAEDENIKLDNTEFTRGLKDASYVCGMYTALLNVGFSVEDTMAYILNKMNIEHNIECTKINANASVESAKNVVLSRDKELL